LNKRGVVEFVFSKLAFLIFGIIIISALFYFVNVQKELHNLDKLARSAEGLSNVVGSVMASPYDINVSYRTSFEGELLLNNQSFVLHDGDRRIKTSFPLATNLTGNISLNKCIELIKTENVMEMKQCQ